jgi:hypothetical protein
VYQDLSVVEDEVVFAMAMQQELHCTPILDIDAPRLMPLDYWSDGNTHAKSSFYPLGVDDDFSAIHVCKGSRNSSHAVIPAARQSSFVKPFSQP